MFPIFYKTCGNNNKSPIPRKLVNKKNMNKPHMTIPAVFLLTCYQQARQKTQVLSSGQVKRV